jgi:hypothetical protein
MCVKQEMDSNKPLDLFPNPVKTTFVYVTCDASFKLGTAENKFRNSNKIC